MNGDRHSIYDNDRVMPAIIEEAVEDIPDEI